jgi:hypothetical protein
LPEGEHRRRGSVLIASDVNDLELPLKAQDDVR